MSDNEASGWTGNATPVKIRLLICDGLGYCCPWAFFKLYRKTGLIAARLGCSRRAVQEWKARFKSGEIECEYKENCLRAYSRNIKRVT